jgi:hypothetical protein
MLMRTTLKIDDDVLRAARILADEQGRTIGEVVSELARRGLRPRPLATEGGLPTFEVAPEAGPLTPEMVREALDDA